VLQHVVHTVSYDEALYCSNWITDGPHSYLSAILPENLEFLSLQCREFTGQYEETYTDCGPSNPHTLSINNHLLPKSTLRKPCNLLSNMKNYHFRWKAWNWRGWTAQFNLRQGEKRRDWKYPLVLPRHVCQIDYDEPRM